MKWIKRTSIMALMFVWAAVSLGGEPGWLDNFEKAKIQAAKQQVPILVNFSGSDWCGWCKRLDKEVFSEEAFKKYAKENLVLFVADFPRYKSLPDEISKQNKYLANEYGIQGFPTILLVDQDGKLIARTGYRPGGPKDYIQHLKGLIEKDKTKE